MPTYEYQCLDCHYQVEYFQSIKEEPRTECPKCHGHLKRMVSSGAGLIFKGSGFYITDYKNNHSSTDNGSRHSSTEPKKEEPKAVPEKAVAEN